MLCAHLGRLLGAPGRSTLLEQKVISVVEQRSRKCIDEGLSPLMAFWGQLNLSWLTSILFPPRADLGKTSQQVVSRSPPPKRMCAKDVKKLFANHMIHG
jgi:hypothetical protein